MKVQLDLKGEEIDKIIVSSLKQHYRYFNQIKDVPVFSFDPDEEKQRLNDLKKAFKTLIKYYGG